MLNARKVTGFAVATAAAGLFATAAVNSVHAAAHAKEGGKVQCLGINACKGQGACATASNACKGQNACKGKGMVEVSAKECEAKGGTVKKG